MFAAGEIANSYAQRFSVWIVEVAISFSSISFGKVSEPNKHMFVCVCGARSGGEEGSVVSAPPAGRFFF